MTKTELINHLQRIDGEPTVLVYAESNLFYEIEDVAMDDTEFYGTVIALWCV